MGPYPRTLSLKNGSQVILRPLHEDDLDNLYQFYLELPEEDRYYLRVDVTDRRLIAMQMEDSDAEERTRFVALSGDRIVGQAALLSPRHGWLQHTGELRCVIAHDFQDQGLAKILLRELFEEATRQGVEILFGKMAAEQTAAVHIMQELGFRKAMVRRNHQRTLHGDLHDVIMMTCSIQEAWARLEDLMHAMDGQGRESPTPRRDEA
jgi:RimJ/RimL family protein N-acetyltransferase